MIPYRSFERWSQSNERPRGSVGFLLVTLDKDYIERMLLPELAERRS